VQLQKCGRFFLPIINKTVSLTFLLQIVPGTEFKGEAEGYAPTNFRTRETQSFVVKLLLKQVFVLL